MRVFNSVPTFLCGLLASLVCSGCFWVTTKHEGTKLREDVNQLDQRLTKKEEDLQSKVDKLQAILDEATNVLKRNSADLGAEFDTFRDEVNRLKGLLTEAKAESEAIRTEVKALADAVQNDREVLAKRLESMEQRIAALEDRTAAPPPVPKTAEELYKDGKAAFDSGNWDEAHTNFRQLVSRFPGHDRADDAQYHRGEAYYKAKDYDSAIRELQKVFDKYETSPLADDALYLAGQAAQALRRCTEAGAYYGLLKKKHAKSSLVKDVEARQKDLKRDAKDPKKCVN